MLSWTEYLIKEAEKDSDDEMDPLKLARDEGEYQLFKKILQGKPAPISRARKQFLEDYKTWVFKHVVDNPDLKRGQAIILTKQAIFDPEKGAGNYFELQTRFKVVGVDATQTQTGWTVFIRFQAVLLRQREEPGAEPTVPSRQELEADGFFLDEPKPRREPRGEPREEPREEPRKGPLSFEYTTSFEDGMLGGEPMKKSEAQMVLGKIIRPKIKSVLHLVKADMAGVDLVFNPKKKRWSGTLRVEGTPKRSVNDVEKAGFTLI